MSKVRDAIDNTVSISLLNKGYAGKIFDDVKSTGTKVVMKNNTPDCVLVSPDSYRAMLDEINELRAVCNALLRFQNVNPMNLIAEEEFRRKINMNADEPLSEGVTIE